VLSAAAAGTLRRLPEMPRFLEVGSDNDLRNLQLKKDSTVGLSGWKRSTRHTDSVHFSMSHRTISMAYFVIIICVCVIVLVCFNK